MMTDQPKDAESVASLTEALTEAVGEGAVFTDAHDKAAYESGWRYGEGKALVVVKPRSTAQVAGVVRICREAGVPLQPIGANTGLVGASNPDASGAMVVLSMERMGGTIDYDPSDGTVLVDGGVLLSQLNEALAPYGRTFPIDLGADPQVGGMVVTNTGGSRLVRYGDVRANLLGLECVLPDGDVLSQLTRLAKNNTGLDAKHLFVGTSGAFGIVTRAVLKTWPLPKQTVGALVFASSGDAVVRLLQALEPKVGELLSAYEAISRGAAQAVLEHGSLDRDPYGGAPPAYSVLVELASTLPAETLDLEALLGEALMEHMESEDAGIADVVVGDVQDFWHVRHQISESLRESGTVLGLDISVPRGRMAELTDRVTATLHEAYPFVRVCDFGHWGDGGSHLNLVWSPEDAGAEADSLKGTLQRQVYDLVVKGFGGSYSAEHCVGPHNIDAYHHYTPEAVRDLCARIAPERFGTVDL